MAEANRQPSGESTRFEGSITCAEPLARYRVYGIELHSDRALPYPEDGPSDLGALTFEETHAAFFSGILKDLTLVTERSWAIARVPDGSTYLRWSGLFEFLVAPDGRAIKWHPLGDHAWDALHTHLGASLSFALINLGIEPLHSTTVVIDRRAVALMGDCGYGKSSLAAEFLRAGHRLLTDDLLVLRQDASGFAAYPGSARIKLFPEMAAHVLGPGTRGAVLAHLTPKLIIPLDASQSCQSIVPLEAIYVLTPPSSRSRAPEARIRSLSRRQAFVELVRNTFNMAVTNPERLRRQLALASSLALAVPVKSLSYPRRRDMLAGAREAILKDLPT